MMSNKERESMRARVYVCLCPNSPQRHINAIRSRLCATTTRACECVNTQQSASSIQHSYPSACSVWSKYRIDFTSLFSFSVEMSHSAWYVHILHWPLTSNRLARLLFSRSLHFMLNWIRCLCIEFKINLWIRDASGAEYVCVWHCFWENQYMCALHAHKPKQKMNKLQSDIHHSAHIHMQTCVQHYSFEKRKRARKKPNACVHF